MTDLEAENARLREALKVARASALEEAARELDEHARIIPTLGDAESFIVADACRDSALTVRHLIKHPSAALASTPKPPEAAREPNPVTLHGWLKKEMEDPGFRAHVEAEALKLQRQSTPKTEPTRSLFTPGAIVGIPFTPKAEAAREECPRCATLEKALKLVRSISYDPRHPDDRRLAMMPDSPMMDEVRAALTPALSRGGGK